MGGSPEPQLLEIPGAQGVSVDFLTNLLQQPAPNQQIPQLNVGPAQQIPGLNVGPAMQMPGLNVGPAQQIPLQQIAGMGANEQTTQNLLSKYLGSSTTGGQAYKLGMGELQKTLGGEFYDPGTSDFWKGYREVSEMEQAKGVAGVRRRGQLGGGLYATPNQRTEAEYVQGMGAKRVMMLGSLFEGERDRKTGAVGQALGFAGLEEQGTLSRLQAGAQIGAIPRQVQNQQYLAAYNQASGQSGANFAQQQAQNQSVYNQQLGQGQANFAQQQAQNQSAYNQLFGQGQADYSQQQQQNQAIFGQQMGQSQADYASQLFPYTAQAGIAGSLMPQWNIPGQDSGAGPLGLLGSIIQAIPK